MDYQIALSPDLSLSPVDFVAAWNGTPECRAVAEARLTESSPVRSFDPTLVAGGAAALLGSVAVGVATSALYDLIKRVFAKKGVRKETEIMQLDQPDGTRLLVIRITE